jgi:predicted transcriptional regulator
LLFFAARAGVNLKEIIERVEGKLLGNPPASVMDMDIADAGASDMMSDVLAYAQPGCLLLTGLMNVQAVRTAEMADVAAIVFVRGKIPEPEVISLAEELGIPLIASRYGMYELCGRLFQAGLKPTMKK